VFELLERWRWATWALVVAFAISVTAGAVLLIAAFRPGLAETFVAAGLLAAAVGIGYLAGERGVVGRFGPKVGDSPLRAKADEALDEAAICFGESPPSLVLLDSISMNAAAVGDEPGRRVIITTTATVECLDRDALRAVFAHELAHFAHRDTIWYPVITLMTGLWRVAVALTLAAFAFGLAGGAVFLMLLLAPGLVLLFALGPFLARLAQVAFLRVREYEADAAAALSLRDPAALSRALIAMDGRLNTIEGAGMGTSHMFSMPPEQTSILEVHPSVASRVERLRMANPSDQELSELVGDYLEQRAVQFADRERSRLLDD
jgi:Zn-dependent protease with chaperone function